MVEGRERRTVDGMMGIERVRVVREGGRGRCEASAPTPNKWSGRTSIWPGEMLPSVRVSSRSQCVMSRNREGKR